MINHLKDNSYISDVELIEYIPLVNRIARRLKRQVYSAVDIGELVEEGMIGLVDARNNYDSSYNTKFQTYAEYRIKGAMLDYIRDNGLLSRSLAKERRGLDAITHSLEQELLRAPNEEEVAKRYNLDISTLSKIRESLNIVILSLDDNYPDGKNKNIDDLPISAGGNYTSDKTNDTDNRLLCESLLKRLPQNYRNVIRLYYYEDRTMADIGDLLGMSEANVRRLHIRALSEFKKMCNRIFSDDNDE